MEEVEDGKTGEISLPLQLALIELINKLPSIRTVSPFIITMFISEYGGEPDQYPCSGSIG